MLPPCQPRVFARLARWQLLHDRSYLSHSESEQYKFVIQSPDQDLAEQRSPSGHRASKVARFNVWPSEFGSGHRQNNKKNPRKLKQLLTALLLFFNLYGNVQLVKRAIVTTVIYCDITTKFHYE